jgi:hypothetical protein
MGSGRQFQLIARNEVLVDFSVFYDHEEISGDDEMALHQLLDAYDRGEARCKDSASDLF